MDRPTGAGYAYCCPYCDVRGMWSITRVGDVARSWACPEHLSQVLEFMQRDYEVTDLVVKLAAKAVEWESINQSLREQIQ